MIKYVIKTGSSFLNKKARIIRDVSLKPRLKGMYCKKCFSDTKIEFIESDLTHVKTNIVACCEYFEKRIQKKLWPNRD